MRDGRFTHTQNTLACAEFAPVQISRHLSACTEGVYLITYANRWLAVSYSRHTELVSRACILAAPRKWYRAAKLFLSTFRKHGCGQAPKLEGANEATQRRVSWKHPQTGKREYEKEKNEKKPTLLGMYKARAPVGNATFWHSQSPRTCRVGRGPLLPLN